MDPEIVETPEVPEAPESLRDTLDAAFTEAETPEPSDTLQPTPAPARVEEESKEVKPEEPPPPAEAKADLKAETIPQAPPIPPKKAPSSWSPAQREKWGALDPELQTQILKREREISNGFNEIHEVRKFRDTFLNTINPHQAVFAAEGNDPLRTVGNLLQTASTLYHGSSVGKAQTVAAIIKNFGVDLRMLDDILAGQTPAPQEQGFQPQQIQQLISQQIQQALGPVFQHQQQKEQELEQTIVSELQAFADDPANEFYEDVKMTMADILDMAANRNEKMSLQTAYNRAILMHNDIAEVVQERKLREAAAKSNQAAQTARRRSRSISGSPTPNIPGSQGNSLRASIEQAMEQSST